QRVITVVIAKRSFGSSQMRRRLSYQSKLGLSRQTMSRLAQRISRQLEFLPGKQRRKHELRHVFRQRRNRSEDERRWPTKKHGHRQRLTEKLSFVIMKAAAFLNLPVQSGRMRIVDLHPVNAEIVLFSYRMLGVDQRQSDEWTTIFLPGRQYRQL